MDDKDYLWRYTNIPSLINILTQKKLTLLDPASWDDRNDSYYMALYKERKSLQSLLALCFAQSRETYHHWRVFADGSSGACIRFRRDPLLKAVAKKAGITARPVTYLTINEIGNKALKVDQLPYSKRQAYEHEDEFRLVYESKSTKHAAYDVPISLIAIERITLSPWIHPSLSDGVKKTLKSLPGCADLEIVRSTLISNEEWKRIGEEANP